MTARPGAGDASAGGGEPAGGIELQAVSKRYGSDPAAPLVVDAVSVRIPRGSLTTLLGPSGCGKTTTLRMIAGLEAPTSGRIVIDGRDVTDLPAAERDVSMVFQSYALFPHMNVIANVAYGLDVGGMRRAQARERARATMAIVGLVDLDERLPSELSGGQQQRVALARALVLEPAVLLFDEPLSNLDARLRRSMREEIRGLQQRLGLTVAYVTHDQEEAMAVSDRIIVMDRGRIAQTGTPRELYERPRSEFVAGFMGEAVLFEALALPDGTLRLGPIVIRPAERVAAGRGADRDPPRGVAGARAGCGRARRDGRQDGLPRQRPRDDLRHRARPDLRRLGRRGQRDQGGRRRQPRPRRARALGPR